MNLDNYEFDPLREPGAAPPGVIVTSNDPLHARNCRICRKLVDTEVLKLNCPQSELSRASVATPWSGMRPLPR